MFEYIRVMLTAKWSEKGQGIVEYALILAFVVAIAVVALSSDGDIGSAIKNLFKDTGDAIKDAGPSTGGGSTAPATPGS